MRKKMVLIVLVLLFLGTSASAEVQAEKVIEMAGDRNLIVFTKTADLEGRNIVVFWDTPETHNQPVWDGDRAEMPPQGAEAISVLMPYGWKLETSFQSIGPSYWYQIPETKHKLFLPLVAVCH